VDDAPEGARIDLQQHPVSGIKIGIEGGGNALVTGEDGKVILTLSGNTK
jgi:hypothetical protein